MLCGVVVARWNRGVPAVKRALFYALLAHSALVLAYRWNQPLVGEHAFRQAQTGISVYWLLHGGPYVAYWTPVMGPPWAIPYEFPLFQWCVALLAYMGVAVDNAGRFVSWFFGLATLWPLRAACRRFHVDGWGAGCLYLASPLYLYWSTAFLIDTTALFLAAMFLMLALEGKWILALVFGVLAALTKLPTVIPFAALLLLWSCWPLVSRGGIGRIWSSRARRSEPC